jgi:hypothetical protein
LPLRSLASTGPRRPILLAILALWLVLLGTRTAWAGKPSMIPPGHEQEIRDLVARALEPADLGKTSIQLDRDRIRVDPGHVDGPRFVLFHPRAHADGAELGDPLARGVIVACGPTSLPRRCNADERERWRSTAEALARERDPSADRIWTIEETPNTPTDDRARSPRSKLDRTIDRIAAGLALALALGLCGLGLARRRTARWAASPRELGVVAGLVALFVLLTASFTSLWPLHEHASFVARSDCAIDPRCTEDPIGAWSPSSLHLLGLILGVLPYRLDLLAWASLAASVVMMLLAWALTRRLLIELGRPHLGPFGAATTLLVLVTHPVHWRLAGAASFWPYMLACLLGAALAGLWASREARLPPAMLGWLLAALLLAFACGGNLVLLTLGPLGLLAPLCWTRARFSANALRRAVILGLPAAVAFALVNYVDLIEGFAWAFGGGNVGAKDYAFAHVWENFSSLFFDARISPLVWAPLLVLAPAWLSAALRRQAPDLDRGHAREPDPNHLHPLRLCLPLIYAGGVPHVFLGQAADELIGSGYPVGFLNHHWEFVHATIAVGLGGAWLVGALARGSARSRRFAPAIPAALALLALALAPLAREGWRMATGAWVVERELAALQSSFARLPEHDLLLIAPRLLPPIDGAPLEGDPLEVNFPAGAYAHALQSRGIEPAEIVQLHRFFTERQYADVHARRTLVYVGSSLRAFQPSEIRGGVVPGALERPELARLRERFELEPVHEFDLPAAQHEAISLRLGADRVETLTLGFYWLHRRRR